LTEAIIEADGVVKRFGKVEALAGLGLVACSGQVTAVLGPNGAGKTTFVRTVATLIRPDAGTLRVAGIDVGRHPEQVRQAIGLAGQYAAVEPTMTGRENLHMVARLFGRSRRQAAASTEAVLAQLGLTDVADRLVKTYSGGLRRRLDLGASLVGAPRLLLLDEPTTGLDPRSRNQLWEAIRGLVAQGTDVLLTTQYLDEADQLASQVAIIDHGRVIARGTPAELKALAGNLGDTGVVAWGTAITAAIGFALGFRLHDTAAQAFLAFGLCLLCGFAFLWIFICIGLVSRNAQAAQGFSMLAYPVIFVSSAYVRVNTLPSWMQPVAQHQPVTVMCNAVRSLALGNPALAGLGHTTTYWALLSLAWAAGIMLVFVPLAATLYRRSS
jgi:ABC-2 type transport system ATP-binding protein